MTGLGVILIVVGMILAFFEITKGFSLAMIVVGTVLMFRGESRTRNRIVMDQFGVRKAYEKPSKADLERVEVQIAKARQEQRAKEIAPIHRMERERIDREVAPLSYYASFVKTRDEWVAISNDWASNESGEEKEVEGVDKFSEDSAVVQLHEKLTRLKLSGNLISTLDN